MPCSPPRPGLPPTLPPSVGVVAARGRHGTQNPWDRCLLPQRRWAHIWDKKGGLRLRGYQRLEDQLAAHLDTFSSGPEQPPAHPHPPALHACRGAPRAGPRTPHVTPHINLLRIKTFGGCHGPCRLLIMSPPSRKPSLPPRPSRRATFSTVWARTCCFTALGEGRPVFVPPELLRRRNTGCLFEAAAALTHSLTHLGSDRHTGPLYWG